MTKTVLIATVLFGLTGALSAAEKSGSPQKRWDAERRQADEEAQEEDKLTLDQKAKVCKVLNGILTIQGDLDDGNPEVVGALTCTDDQKIYLLKLESKDVIKVLQRNDNRKITLSGHLRNSGKYLVVTGLVEHQAGPPRVARRSMGGI